MKTRKLSDVPSKMLIQALEDLELVLADPWFFVDMNVWYTPRGRYRCEVCHAGAVIAKSLGNGTLRKAPEDFGPAIARKLYAINHFRAGNLDSAFYELGIALPPSLPLYNFELGDSYCDRLFRDIDYFPQLGNKIQVNAEYRTFYFNYFQDLIGILQAEGL